MSFLCANSGDYRNPSLDEHFERALASVRRTAQDYTAQQTSALHAQLHDTCMQLERARSQCEALRTALERLLTWRASDFDQPADIAREALALLVAPSALMTVQEARRRNVCRICGQPATTPLTLNYGDEFAHTACLNEAATTRPARSSADDCAKP